MYDWWIASKHTIKIIGIIRYSFLPTANIALCSLLGHFSWLGHFWPLFIFWHGKKYHTKFDLKYLHKKRNWLLTWTEQNLIYVFIISKLYLLFNCVENKIQVQYNIICWFKFTFLHSKNNLLDSHSSTLCQMCTNSLSLLLHFFRESVHASWLIKRMRTPMAVAQTQTSKSYCR